jgi:exodeoxyribonuclease-5
VIDLDFSPDQLSVLDAIQKWRACSPREGGQYLTLGALAGTGKTTLISYLADLWPHAAVVAVCGKAAHVLRSRGTEARTVHSLLYIPLKAPGGRVRFKKRRSLGDVRTIIVDEASMIDHLLYIDLLSFGLPVLFVGDHGQLEPIGTNANLMANPMLRLETIHRQAQGNPILQLAVAFREGRPVPRWTDSKGRLQVLSKREFWDLVSPELQIICGFNKTRHEINRRVRKMRGHAKELVVPGEKLICVQNNKNFHLFNGQQVTAISTAYEGKRTIDIKVETDDYRILTLPCLRRQFGQDPIRESLSKDVALFDYGWCLSAHRAQGSEWGSVLALEEIHPSWNPQRWRYTVVTRAKERLVYCM